MRVLTTLFKEIENLRIQDQFQWLVCFCFRRYSLTCCSCVFRFLTLSFNVSWSSHQCTSHWKVFLIILAACTSSMVCLNNLFYNKLMFTHFILGRVARKPVNAKPGLKVNRRSNFSGIKMFFTSFILCRLRLLTLESERQTI